MSGIPLDSNGSGEAAGGLPPELLAQLTPETLSALRHEAKTQLARQRLALYRPYTKQRDFHAMGATHRERLLMAGNQLGKTWCGGAEAAFHLTGLYPDWWEGHRFHEPTAGWAAGVTSETTRDTVQRVLLGPPNAFGTGMIPESELVDIVPARGIANAIDYVTVKHRIGGQSRLGFKSYERGREKWQGETLNFLWLDEEAPEDIYDEGLTRLTATSGIMWTTFTPLQGMSEVVRRFYPKPNTAQRGIVQMSISDVDHISPEQRETIVASYKPHEREARAKGIPVLGSGRIFPLAESLITCVPFEIPSHWAVLGGIDFGWDHPTAAVKLAVDRDTDTVYVTAEYCVSEATPVVHAAALRHWGKEMAWAWPHDGLQHDKGSGDTIADLYRDEGLNMLPARATFDDGSHGVEAGLMMMLDRMKTGRLKVFPMLTQWMEEFRLYHRRDGRVVKEHDDLMSATRYALMMLRFASQPSLYASRQALNRDVRGIV